LILAVGLATFILVVFILLVRGTILELREKA